MPLPSLDELLRDARNELDREFDALKRELQHVADDVKKRRLAEVDELVNWFASELKRIGSR
ncbi:apolipoprotein AI [Pyrolobus fumarii 1A]|uniref:Apolipoprotein AI n=1 Tax=Pyrolobus fumarii (strain DSM 11204 / 1A) TaxID=694429 RepID=G0EDM0_PYRF1|nr:hypothetical protein [Pyrolobus fumarii]AEM39824.1 apolipoprotein AI [Pyrolobus fumarii 1A]